MADFIAISDVRDAMLSRVMTAADLTETDKYIYHLSASLGVAEADVIKGANTPYIVKRLASAYACMITARNNAGVNPERYENGIRDDAYMIKYDAYRMDVNALESQVSAEILIGTADTKEEYASRSVRMYRR